MDNIKYTRIKRNYPIEEVWTYEWLIIRERIIAAYDHKCFRCKTNQRRLEVHHIQYEEGKRAWEYEDSNFVPLCAFCHAKEHLLSDVTFFMVNLALSNNMIIDLDIRRKAEKEFGLQSNHVYHKLNFLAKYGFLTKDKSKENNKVFYTVRPHYDEYYPFFDIFNPTVFERSNEIDYIVTDGGGVIESGSEVSITYIVKKDDIFIDNEGKPCVKVYFEGEIKLGGVPIFKRKQ